MTPFFIGKVRHMLDDDPHDDSRIVVRADDAEYNVLLKFDNSLFVHDGEGTYVGHISPNYINGAEANFLFIQPNGVTTDLNVKVSGYKWTSIMAAELEVAKIVLKQST